MRMSYGADAGFEGFAHAGIIPGFDLIDIDAIGAFFFLEPFEGFRDRAFGGLVLAGNGDTITVVPYKNGEGHLQHACGVYGLPKMAFTGGGIADGAETDLVAMVRELGELLEDADLAKSF